MSLLFGLTFVTAWNTMMGQQMRLIAGPRGSCRRWRVTCQGGRSFPLADHRFTRSKHGRWTAGASLPHPLGFWPMTHAGCSLLSGGRSGWTKRAPRHRRKAPAKAAPRLAPPPALLGPLMTDTTWRRAKRISTAHKGAIASPKDVARAAPALWAKACACPPKRNFI